MKLVTGIFVLLSVFVSIHGLKILAVIPIMATSHYNIGNGIVKSLLKAGHEVTVIEPYPPKNSVPNRHDIVVDVQKGVDKNMPPLDMFAFGKAGIIMQFFGLYQFTKLIADVTLSDEKVQKLLNSNEKFDLVVYEVFGIDALVGLGQHFGCPVVGYTTFGASIWYSMIMGNPIVNSYVPDPFSSYTAKMNFEQRFYNTLSYLGEELVNKLFYYRDQRELYKKHFPNSKSTFDEDLKNISLILANDHFTQSAIKPYLPNIIEISGIHVEETKPLSEEWKSYLDGAKDGVIYFSMGSNIKSKDWPVEKREALVEAFRKVKLQVLWKYENETLPNKPKNVKIAKWLPQRDILSHPNIKLFITHGGLLGSTEAIVAGKPVLGIPIFGDQKMNIARAIQAGYGSKIDFDEMSAEKIFTTIEEMIKNPKYLKTAQKISKLFNDRPMTPQQTAVYWVEYVARHQGAPHLKSPGVHLSFIEFNSIDVFAAIFLLAFIIFYVIYKILSCLFGVCYPKEKLVAKVKMP